MKSIFYGGVMAAIAAVGLVLPAPAQSETLRVGMECTYAPFNFRTAEGQLDGYDVDVAKAIGTRLGSEIEYVCQKWDGMIPALLANKFDLIIASMSITEKRLEKIDFSVPYRVSIGRFVGAKARGFELFNADGSVNTEKFSGLKVGVPRASTYDNWIQGKVPEAAVVRYDGTEAMYLDLQNGRVDVIMTNPMKAFLKFLSKEDGAGYEFVSPALDEKKYFGTGVGVALNKGNDELLGKINAALKDIIEGGELEKFALKYFPFAIGPQKWAGVN